MGPEGLLSRLRGMFAFGVWDRDKRRLVLVARHRLTAASAGWVTVPEHHQPLWAALEVERRPLAICEEVGQWN